MEGKKGLKSKIVTALYILLVLFPCIEIAIRLVGGKPYIQDDYSIIIAPSNAYLGDDSLGIKLNEGVYDITLNKKVDFTATHTSKGIRKTPRLDSFSIESKAAFFGCSFTYGYGVNDSQTFVANLQKKHPNKEFNNYGVIGYGTVQSYLQLEELIKNMEVPEEVFLVFSSFHLERNGLAPNYRRSLKIGFSHSMNGLDKLMEGARFPFYNKLSELSFVHWDSLYSDWIGRSNFATVNYFQTAWDGIKTNKMDLVEISKSCVLEMSKLCSENGVEFNLVLLDNEKEMEVFSNSIKNEKIKVIRVGFDFSDSTLTNAPYDMHPNAFGHQKIALTINEFLVNKSSHND